MRNPDDLPVGWNTLFFCGFEPRIEDGWILGIWFVFVVQYCNNEKHVFFQTWWYSYQPVHGKSPRLSNKITQHVNSQAKNIMLSSIETVDGWNPAPVDVGSLSLYLQGVYNVLYARGGAGFLLSTHVPLLFDPTSNLPWLTSACVPAIGLPVRILNSSHSDGSSRWKWEVMIRTEDVCGVYTAWSGKHIFVYNVSCQYDQCTAYLHIYIYIP